MIRYSVPTSVLVQDVLTETVVLDTEKGIYYELNAMGTEIFKRLQAGNDVSAILEELLSEFDVTESELRQDFDHLVLDLEEHGLLEKMTA